MYILEALVLRRRELRHSHDSSGPQGCGQNEQEAASPADGAWPSTPIGYRLELARARTLRTVQGLMRAYFTELGLENDPAWLDKDLQDLESGYQSGGLIVLLHEQEPVGCIGLRRIEPGVGEIKRMYIEPGHRKGGLGRALLESALNLARSKGFSRLLLDTRRDLKAANALYERFGFKDTKDYNQNPRAERFMILDLG